MKPNPLNNVSMEAIWGQIRQIKMLKKSETDTYDPYLHVHQSPKSILVEFNKSRHKRNSNPKFFKAHMQGLEIRGLWKNPIAKFLQICSNQWMLPREVVGLSLRQLSQFLIGASPMAMALVGLTPSTFLRFRFSG